MFCSAICFTVLKFKITALKCSIGSWSNIKQNNEAENAVEALLFGHFANMFAQLPKNSVLVSWLLSPLLSNRFNICSVWQANRCVGTWRTSLCGNTNKPSVFINPAFAAASPTGSLLFFFSCSSKLVLLMKSTSHRSPVLQEERRQGSRFLWCVCTSPDYLIETKQRCAVALSQLTY